MSVFEKNLIEEREKDSYFEVPFIDLSRQNTQYKYEIKLAINRVLESGIYTSGPETEGFEGEFAQYTRVPYCIGVSNGTMAIEIGLKALGVNKGDGVLTVANAGMQSTEVIRDIGAIPQFVEIDPHTLTMSPESLENEINSQSRVVIATHLYGRVADIPALKNVADRRGLPILEDCSQANGARLNGNSVGTSGAIGCFCFSPARNLGALGEAGVIVARDQDVAEKVRGICRKNNEKAQNSHVNLGSSKGMNELQAAVLRAKLPMLEEWNLRRRMIAQTYNIHLETSDPRIHCDSPSDGSVFQFFVIRTSQRDYVRDYLHRKGIGTAIHYPVPAYLQTAGINLSDPNQRLPGTEKACAEVLSLPCYPELNSWEVKKVCEVVNESLANL